MTVTPIHPAPSPCLHERGHITDSRFYGGRYATALSREVFCDDCRNQRWLTIEAALAQAEAELGIIPASAAQDIVAAARVELLDLNAVRDEIDRSGHSLVGLLRIFELACPGESGQYIHYGATTQDIQDTGQVLEMRDILDAVDDNVFAIVECLARHADEHAETVALGRTHAQPALPIAFGLKVASWLDEMLRHTQRLAEIRPRVLVAQLFGGAGTMAGFGPKGPELMRLFADRLGLEAPIVGWHVARDRVVEFVNTLAMIAGTLARIAEEIRILSRPEFGEVEEAWRPGKVGSSTMPHKRNPERCEQVVVMARLAAAQVGLAHAAMIGDHERDSRSLRIEWACVPDISHYTLAACEIMLETLSGLTVHSDRLRLNVQDVAERVASEKLMLALGEHIGKQRAHEAIYQLMQDATEQGVAVSDLVQEREEIVKYIDWDTMKEIFDPSAYLGSSTVLTRSVVTEARKVVRSRGCAVDGTSQD